MEISELVLNGITIVTTHGDITPDDIKDLSRKLDNVCKKDNPQIILDIFNTAHISSMGLATIANYDMITKNKHGKLILVLPSNHVDKLLHITGLSNFLSISNSIDEAKTIIQKEMQEKKWGSIK